ncbi:3'-5' exonuclease [Aquabacterium sp.]|jgi:DNA polymerase-3 subunit epsilon|uniref:3'-5' exonuclease n=1 Tax=Aquabacterium sp. TaxID=1872578 RepID=UPI001B78E0A2|nr:3'-5' exonuclease [Aquabacterium sp.]MBP6616213.1 DNA polymerase III subunit epsilon [Aquabacterium sp.]MDD2977456.1 3'-5' exonuclease [Aquabacterium sp.]
MARTPNPTPLLDASFADPEAMAEVLDGHPDYRVLRRLKPRREFGHKRQGEIAKVLILDTETTGLDSSKDRLIELALILVDVDKATGLPLQVQEVFDELEDPGRPIPAEATRVTGITDAMVAGKRLNEARVAELMAGVDLVIAHNARFDRGFMENRLPAFAKLPWACSVAEIDWQAQGRGSAKLEFLAHELGFFYDAHRAEMDCHALLAVLAAPLPNTGETGLARLLAAAQATSYRVQATGSPFSSKDALRARGYRWDAERKVWHTQVGNPAALDAECEWLKKDVYGGRSARIDIERQTALERFSSRAGECLQRDL